MTIDRLYVVRHGQTQWNLVDRFQGRLDSPLTDAGKQHAVLHGELLARESVDHLIASPLGRTRATAELVNQRLGATLVFDDRLVERDCGAWSGLTADEIRRDFADEWGKRVDSPYYHRPPGGGENLEDMLARVRPLLDGLHTLPHARVALISHGIMGRVILSYLLNIAPGDAGVIRQPNDVVFRVSFASRDLECDHFKNGIGPHRGFPPGRQIAD